MIQKHIKKVNTDTEIIDNIICNCCGKPIHKAKNMCGNTMFVDYIEFKDNRIERQRYPEFIEDFHLCEDCLNSISGQFIVPVKKINI
jgi:hypothetical protein